MLKVNRNHRNFTAEELLAEQLRVSIVLQTHFCENLYRVLVTVLLIVRTLAPFQLEDVTFINIFNYSTVSRKSNVSFKPLRILDNGDFQVRASSSRSNLIDQKCQSFKKHYIET